MGFIELNWVIKGILRFNWVFIVLDGVLLGFRSSRGQSAGFH